MRADPQGVVALALTSRATFSDRVAAFGRPHAHHVLIWSFRDLIHPYMILECPHEVTTFDFNPLQHHIIAGGCSNGQMVQWEISDDIMDRAAQVPKAPFPSSTLFSIIPA
jgi:hypothetical protein